MPQAFFARYRDLCWVAVSAMVDALHSRVWPYHTSRYDMGVPGSPPRGWGQRLPAMRPPVRVHRGLAEAMFPGELAARRAGEGILDDLVDA